MITTLPTGDILEGIECVKVDGVDCTIRYRPSDTFSDYGVEFKIFVSNKLVHSFNMAYIKNHKRVVLVTIDQNELTMLGHSIENRRILFSISNKAYDIAEKFTPIIEERYFKLMNKKENRK